jgi:hypothetical protein
MSLISHFKNYSFDSNDKTQKDSCKRKLNLNILESMKYLTGLTDTSDNPTGHCLMKSNSGHNNTLSASSALQVVPFAAVENKPSERIVYFASQQHEIVSHFLLESVLQP